MVCPDCGAEEIAVGIHECERRLRDMICPQCRKPFELSFNDYSNRPVTLILRGCPSGGIYDAHISCPHCNYEEPL